jgi:hypothetical protein
VLDASTSPPKERYAVSKDNIIKLIQSGNVEDQFTEILRNGVRSLLAQALEAEVADFLGKRTDLKTSDGRQRVVRHGHLPEHEVMTGIGPVASRQPRVRDREADAADPDRMHAAWHKRELSAKRYVWADGIHLEARLEDEEQCILVLIGADARRPHGVDRLHRWGHRSMSYVRGRIPAKALAG